MNAKSPTAPTPTEAYKYCPKCAGNFKHKGGNWLQCSQCDYNFFVNAAPTAGVFIFNDKGEVLLAKRKFDPYKGTWQVPGGFMHPNETAEEALHREIDEELGVKVQLGKFVSTIPDTYIYGGVALPFLGIYYTATVSEGEIKPKDDVEEVRFVNLEEARKLDITYPALRLQIEDILAS